MLVKERESACVCLSRTSPTSLSLSVSLSLFLSPFLLRRLPLSFFALAHARVRTSSSTFSSFSSKVSVPHAPSSTPLSLFLSPFLLRSLPLYLRVGSRTGAHACSHNPPSLSPPSEEFVSHTSPTPTLLHLFFFLSLSPSLPLPGSCTGALSSVNNPSPSLSTLRLTCRRCRRCATSPRSTALVCSSRFSLSLLVSPTVPFAFACCPSSLLGRLSLLLSLFSFLSLSLIPVPRFFPQSLSLSSRSPLTCALLHAYVSRPFLPLLYPSDLTLGPHCPPRFLIPPA